MTLDEAIRSYSEKAERYSILAISEKDKKVAKNYKNIAEWLKELRAYRNFKDALYKSCDEWCKFPEYKESGTMCGACEIGGIKDLLEIALEEVKADDNISED